MIDLQLEDKLKSNRSSSKTENTAPVIGITVGSDNQGTDTTIMYTEAVKEAGGTPALLFPRTTSDGYLSELLSSIQGLLLSGGKDLHPKYYLKDISDLEIEKIIAENDILIDEFRDQFEVALLRSALEYNLPIFGICRGIQVLNVVMGGQLLPDIRTSIQHKAYSNAASRSHNVKIAADSIIACIIGAGECKVNSRHHQGFTETQAAKDLRVTASAEDGIVEAVEIPAHPSWVVAVQWHPERQEDSYIYEQSEALFRAFVDQSARIQ